MKRGIDGKRFFGKAVTAAVMLTLLLAACGGDPVFTDVDFGESSYKHVNNGGVEADGSMPYNIDAITGATLTVEGPAVVTSIPLSMRELENRNEGLYRGVYGDSRGKFVYEGMDLYYLLNGMIDGDNGILLTESAYSVEIKDCNRVSLATFTLEEVIAAHGSGHPILLAYGIGTTDGKTVAPFVFDAANEQEHSEGYVEKLRNDDGCVKLVFDLDLYGEGKGDTFRNAAYVYVREQAEPGFKHTGSGEGVYDASRYADYIVTFRGEALGAELNLTVRQLEALVSYDADGNLTEGGVGYSDSYSLANNAYWYVNQYEGLELYRLLRYLGMEDAETMGTRAARTTLVNFVAADGMESPESFSVDTLSYPDAFGFYNKNAADPGDGSYAPTNADLVDTGYPVLLAYGVNNYPYTIAKGDDGYLSGLSNAGGPLRVVFGKTQYNHANGSNQIQLLKDVIVGEDRLYNTHQYTDVPAYNALAERTLSVEVTAVSGERLVSEVMSVGEVEDIIYGEQVEKTAKRAAFVKDSYEVPDGGGFRSDIYEGVGLAYFMMETLGLPGTNGTATFSNGMDEITVNLDQLFRTGYNTTLGREGLVPVLAYAKNGFPLVGDPASDGYVASVGLHALLPSEPDSYAVANAGGPLTLILPSADPKTCGAAALFGVTDISVSLVPDAYAHIAEPYSGAADETVRFFGDGLEQETVYAAGEIEGKQTKVKTLDFSLGGQTGNMREERYRGIALYELFTEIGIKSNAGDVIIHSADGTETTVSLSLLKRQNFVNYLSPEKPPLFSMLAYGIGRVGEDSMDGLPLVESEESAGYDADYRNAGGPLRLVVPQQEADDPGIGIDHVVAVEVTANEIDTWSHRMSDVYEEFLDYAFTFTVRNDDTEVTRSFTLDELEQMTDLIVRDTYSVLDIGECEGIVIWKFIQRFAAGVPGIEDPVAVTAYAEDGYKNDLLSVFYKEGLELGVANEDGDRKPLMIAYAVNGTPLVDSESHEGYTGTAGNMGGPLRVVAETTQGASVKYVNKLVVTVPGSGAIALPDGVG